LTVPEVTGRPAEVTVITAEAAENCVTLAEGTKLSVVTVGGGGPPANIAVPASSISAAGPLKIEIGNIVFTVVPQICYCSERQA
jgi:hypothetical protein